MPDRPIDKLYKKADEIAGRKVEVDKTKNGKYVALWFRHDVAPPLPGSSEEEALQNFINYMETLNAKEERFAKMEKDQVQERVETTEGKPSILE